MSTKFKPGQSGNPAGRPKGSPNRLTKQLREALKGVVSDELDRLPELLAELEPQARMDAICKLLRFCLPAVNPVQASYGEPLDFSLD